MLGQGAPDSHYDKHEMKDGVTKGSTHSRLYFGLCDIWGWVGCADGKTNEPIVSLRTRASGTVQCARNGSSTRKRRAFRSRDTMLSRLVSSRSAWTTKLAPQTRSGYTSSFPRAPRCDERTGELVKEAVEPIANRRDTPTHSLLSFRFIRSCLLTAQLCLSLFHVRTQSTIRAMRYEPLSVT